MNENNWTEKYILFYLQQPVISVHVQDLPYHCAWRTQPYCGLPECPSVWQTVLLHHYKAGTKSSDIWLNGIILLCYIQFGFQVFNLAATAELEFWIFHFQLSNLSIWHIKALHLKCRQVHVNFFIPELLYTYVSLIDWLTACCPMAAHYISNRSATQQHVQRIGHQPSNREYRRFRWRVSGANIWIMFKLPEQMEWIKKLMDFMCQTSNMNGHVGLMGSSCHQGFCQAVSFPFWNYH